MTYIPNPKQEGSVLIDCIPQDGPCPNQCNECYYNRPGAFYAGHTPNIPSFEDSEGKIVRMNSGHDSNVEKEKVLEAAKKYEDVFFNTSIPSILFGRFPCVVTINPDEDNTFFAPSDVGKDSAALARLMFVRVRVSPTNAFIVNDAVCMWTHHNVPVVLTFMAYWDEIPEQGDLYEKKVRTLNSYHVATRKYMATTISRFVNNPLVYMCGTIYSHSCKDCRICEHMYWLAKSRIKTLMDAYRES